MRIQADRKHAQAQRAFRRSTRIVRRQAALHDHGITLNALRSALRDPRGGLRAAAGIALLLLFIGQPARAQTSGKLFGLKPALAGKTTLEEGHFQYAVKAGSSIEDGVFVYNFTDAPITLQLYAADVVTPQGGGVAPLDQTHEMHEVGAWLTLERSEVTVPGKDRVFVAFAVKVPATLEPGDHLGAVVASHEAEPTPGTIAFEQRVALITRIRIPGTPTLKSKIGPLHVVAHGRRRDFSIELRNVGNLLFTTRGTIDIADGGRRVASLPLSPAEVYVIPNGRAIFRATWQNPPLFGSRRAVATFDTRAKGIPFKRIAGRPVGVRFVPVAWPIAAGITLVALIGLLLIWVRGGHLNRVASSVGRNDEMAGSLR